MSTHPCLPLWIDDYDAATAHLTPAQDGIYGRLLRLAWRTAGCTLPNDEAWLARKVRVSKTEWDKSGKPVIDEFFRLQRGRLVQKRLKAEYDDISRKKSARVEAGKKGGVAKALKTKENSSGNASVLPADTRAFPYPYPDPVAEEGSNEPSLFPEPRFELAAAFAAFWSAYPRKTGKADALKAYAKAVKPDPDALATLIRAGLDRIVPAWAREDARYIPHASTWLNGRRWEDETPPTVVHLHDRASPTDRRHAAFVERHQDIAAAMDAAFERPARGTGLG